MGIMDFIKGELLEVIEWTDDSRDTLSWQFPDEDKAIKNGAQLIVRESQVAQFVYLGEFGDTFKPGKHSLTTDNIPVLTKIKSWPFGFNSPFKADVYFVTTRLFTGNKWGTSNPVMLRDNDFGIVRAARVRDLRLQGRRSQDVPEGGRRIRSQLQARRIQRHDALPHREHLHGRDRERKDPGAGRGVALHRARRGAAAAHQPGDHLEVRDRDRQLHRRERLGSSEVEQAIDKRSSMAAVGNLNDFVKYQMAQGIRRRGRRGRGGYGGGARRRLRPGAADDEGRLHERPCHADGRRGAGGAGVTAASLAGALESGRSRAGSRRH